MCFKRLLLVLLVNSVLVECRLIGSEKKELVKLYHATNGVDWKVSWPNWLKGDPCSEGWKGITCTRDDRHVQEISLEKNRLIGELPFMNLPFLEALDLGSNRLSGTLPRQYGSLPRLIHVEVDGNRFSGIIPEEWQPFSKKYEMRVYLGVNRHPENGMYGFECPYPDFMMDKDGQRRRLAERWGVPAQCGLRDQDATPDEMPRERKRKKVEL